MEQKILTRIAGEARIIIKGKNNIIEDAVIYSSTPIRAFNTFAKGKNPEFVVEAIKRVCGICHAVHGCVSAITFEKCFNINPPDSAKILRKILVLINRCYSHTVAQFLLLKDIFKSEYFEEYYKIIRELMKLFACCTEIVGGTSFHPHNIIIGGFLSPLSEKKKDKLSSLLKIAEEETKKFIEALEDERLHTDIYKELSKIERKIEYFSVGKLEPEYLPERKDIRIEPVTGVEGELKHNISNLVAYYRNKVVETGPRARLFRTGDFTGSKIVDINRARVIEIIEAINEIKELLSEIKEEDRVLEEIKFKHGEAETFYEAPRGVLYHKVKTSLDGRVVEYEIIFPTMFNFPAIREVLKGVEKKFADIIVRLYDPCIPCVVH